MKYAEIPATGQKFHIKGKNPTLLIVSGTHGDEYEVIPLIQKLVNKYYAQLPAFLFVPVVSPSAVKLKTRFNKEGRDLNRSFFEDTECREALEMMKLWEKFDFNLFLTIHEDPGQSRFYLYEGSRPEFSTLKLCSTTRKNLNILVKNVEKLGVNIFEGIDDPHDPVLGNQVVAGQVHWTMTSSDRSADNWLLLRGCVKQVVNPEVPGRLSIDMKQRILQAIFKIILLNKSG